MEILFDILGFGGKVLLVTLAVGIILVVIANLAMRLKPPKKHLEIEDLSDRLDQYGEAIRDFVSDPKTLKAELKARKKAAKLEAKNPVEKKTIYLIDFDGDIRASAVDRLRDEISAILTAAIPGRDEVVVRLESPGGTVTGYGLAASQLLRVREAQIQLTICVDEVAASGGYMMACTANQILAAPFAILGSIGVIAQVPNLHRLLKRHDVDYEEITAGEFKRTVSLLAEITAKGRQKFVEQIEDTHLLFKEFIAEHRPQLRVEHVATGEHWFGKRALDLGLADRIISSDAYLFAQRKEARILEVRLESKQSFGEKLSGTFGMMLEKIWWRWWQQIYNDTVLRSGLR